ncbi:MAG TPA: hypothetical protein VNN22_13235 [Verrucomicrobiae bacterium]|nr:hypothetical protein [Verrucomicrobiae bacterium]
MEELKLIIQLIGALQDSLQKRQSESGNPAGNFGTAGPARLGGIGQGGVNAAAPQQNI